MQEIKGTATIQDHQLYSNPRGQLPSGIMFDNTVGNQMSTGQGKSISNKVQEHHIAPPDTQLSYFSNT